MKLGCSSQSFNLAFQQKRTDIFSWIDYCAATLELDGIEIEDKHFPSPPDDSLPALRERVAERRLVLSSVTIMNNFGLATPAGRAAQVEYVCRWIDRARTLGSSRVRIFAGWPQSADREALWGAMIECLRQVSRCAEQAGVTLCLENHNHGGFVQVAEDVLRIFREVESRWLRLNLDTGNYLDGLESIEKTASYAAHVHAKLRDIAADGSEKTLDYPAIVNALRSAHYDAFISLEYEGRQDPFVVVPRAVDYFRKLLRGGQTH